MQLSCAVRSNSHFGRPTSSSSGTGARPTSAKHRYISVSVMLSGWAGQPGMFTIGMPPLDFHLCPRWSHRPIAPVGLFFIAGMPP